MLLVVGGVLRLSVSAVSSLLSVWFAAVLGQEVLEEEVRRSDRLLGAGLVVWRLAVAVGDRRGG